MRKSVRGMRITGCHERASQKVLYCSGATKGGSSLGLEVLQYDLWLQSEWECSGAYLKYLLPQVVQTFWFFCWQHALSLPQFLVSLEDWMQFLTSWEADHPSRFLTLSTFCWRSPSRSPVLPFWHWDLDVGWYSCLITFWCCMISLLRQNMETQWEPTFHAEKQKEAVEVLDRSRTCLNCQWHQCLLQSTIFGVLLGLIKLSFELKESIRFQLKSISNLWQELLAKGWERCYSEIKPPYNCPILILTLLYGLPVWEEKNQHLW